MYTADSIVIFLLFAIIFTIFNCNGYSIYAVIFSAFISVFFGLKSTIFTDFICRFSGLAGMSLLCFTMHISNAIFTSIIALLVCTFALFAAVASSLYCASIIPFAPLYFFLFFITFFICFVRFFMIRGGCNNTLFLFVFTLFKRVVPTAFFTSFCYFFLVFFTVFATVLFISYHYIAPGFSGGNIFYVISTILADIFLLITSFRATAFFFYIVFIKQRTRFSFLCSPSPFGHNSVTPRNRCLHRSLSIPELCRSLIRPFLQKESADTHGKVLPGASSCPVLGLWLRPKNPTPYSIMPFFAPLLRFKPLTVFFIVLWHFGALEGILGCLTTLEKGSRRNKTEEVKWQVDAHARVRLPLSPFIFPLFPSRL